MKKYLILAAFAVIAAAASAQDGADKKPRGGRGGFMELTDEQKSCIEQQDCPKLEMKEGEKPSKDAMEASRECQKKAFDTCGIQMPERPDHKGGSKGKFEGKGGPNPEPQE
ncbi:MAG: hypothetical protein LBO78_01820 [Rickettsiales bacterium]|jgi:hypothetical protein|nr:hypothetical protein [Rickettsiales bacterium]